MNRRVAGEESTSELSRENGTFEFRLRPGEWSLEAKTDLRHDANDQDYFATSAIVPAPVTDHDIRYVELRLNPTFSMEIRADWGYRQPPADVRPDVWLLPIGGAMYLFHGVPGGRPVSHMLPGRYQIVPLPGSTPGFYAVAITIGGRDVLGQEVDLSVGTPEIRVVYKPNPGSVRGTAGEGEGAIVVLWPEGPAIPPVVRSTQGGPHGAFEFGNVPPGDYTLVAFDRWAAGPEASPSPSCAPPLPRARGSS
jgi:hypothetical protein